MGKSLNNYIGVGESAEQQFGKTLSIPDDLMKEWFTLLTDRTQSEIEALCDTEKTHPMQAKKTLARDIVTFYYGADAASAAQANWEKQFGGQERPGHDPEETIVIDEYDATQPMGILTLLVKVGFCKSNNEARQKVTEGAVNVGPDRTKITGPKGDDAG